MSKRAPRRARRDVWRARCRRMSTAGSLVGDAALNNRLVAKFINCLMHDGKKSAASGVFSGALDEVAKKVKGKDTIEIFEQASRTSSPRWRCAPSAWAAPRTRCRWKCPRSATGPRHPVDPRCGARAQGPPDGAAPRRGAGRSLQQGRRGDYHAGKHSQNGGSQQGIRSFRLAVTSSVKSFHGTSAQRRLP